MNRCKRRDSKQAKDADKLVPKGKWLGAGACTSSAVDERPSAKKRDLTQSGIHAERGKPVLLPQGK